MLAMFTPASPRMRPESPDQPRRVVVHDEEHAAVELDLDLVAEGAHELAALLAADRRSRDGDRLAARVRGDARRRS